MRANRSLAVSLIVAAAFAQRPALAELQTVEFPEFPTLSPDGTTLVFSWAGDLWGAPSQGGAASRLTVHPADERRSSFSPDGTQVAFESNRDGARNIYAMPVSASGNVLVGGNARRLTASDKPQNLGSWSTDGKAVYFTSTIEPAIYRTQRMYQVEIVGPGDPASVGGVAGGPVRLITPAFGSGVKAAGDSVVFFRGYAPAERPKYRGSGQGDVWRMTGSGTTATFTQLTNSDGNDIDPSGLPDGSVVFISSRDGQNNVWRIALGGESSAPATQLTFFKPAADELTIGHGVRDLAVSANGKVAVFCVWDKLYRLDLTEAKPTPKAIELIAQADDVTLDIQRMSLDKEASEAALSPDGKTMAIVARGEIFVRNITEGYPTRRVTMTAGRERDIAWSPDGRVLYFASDDAGPAKVGPDQLGKYAVYAASVELAREDIAPAKPEEKKEDAAKPDDKKPDEKKDDAKPAEDGKKTDEKADAKPKTKKPDFGKRWADALRFRIDPVYADAVDARRPNPSPDAKCLLVTRGRGDVIMIELQHMKSRVLLEGWNEPEAQWAADSRHIVYESEDLDFNADIWLLDTGGFDSFEGDAFKPAAPVNLTRHPDNDTSPRLSLDGKVLTFLSERGEQSDQMDVYQVYLDKDLEGMTSYERDEYYKKSAEAAGKRKPAETPAFVLKELTARGDRAMLPKPGEKADEKKPDAPKDEAKKDEPKKDDGKVDEKKDESKPKPAPKKAEPLKFDSEDAYMRIRRITTGPGNKGSLAVTPGADRIIFSGVFEADAPATPAPGASAAGGGGVSLVSIDYKGSDRKTIVSGSVSNLSVSLTGDKLVYVKSGAVSHAPPKGGKTESVAIDAPVTIDIAQQQRQKFLEAARTFGARFYHPTMKGLDWDGLTRRYLTLAVKTRTPESFNRVTQLLFGETEGSHTGIMGGATYNPPATGTGYLGVRVKAVQGGYEVVKVTPDSPASLKNSRINPGDVIVSVDSKRLSPDDNSPPTLDLDAALLGRSGRETLLEVRRGAATAENKSEPKKDDKIAPLSPFVVITPVSGAAWTALRYNEEVGERRALTEKLSGGKIGYLHIRAMSEPEVRDYERDLYAAGSGKQALLIDVRDNGGGSTADILLSSLTAPNHAYTIPRGADPAKVPHDSYPRDRRLIYSWHKPVNVLINQHSFSNAEIFAHAIKTIGRGKLVGTPTFGGVISTGAFTLIDGTTVRMPFRGWYLPDGTDQENHGAQPDISVPQTPADEATGKDPQLEAAVADLMQRIGQ